MFSHTGTVIHGIFIIHKYVVHTYPLLSLCSERENWEAMRLIEVTHLTKRYGTHEAVSDLNFRLEPGRVYGLLGPNGAGKSTTMNMMTGCLAPTEGTVVIDGLDIYRQARQAKRKIGYLPEIPPVYPDMTVEEYLRFVAGAKKLPRTEQKAAVRSVMERTAVDDMAGRLIRNLSKGYRQRLGIAQALLGDPEIIILDEPSVGLDPKQITEIRELISSLRGERTVILSSHILSEVQAVCDHILILDHGKLAASGTAEELRGQMTAVPRLRLRVKCNEKTARRVVKGIAGVRLVRCAGAADGTTTLELETDGDRNEPVFLSFSQAGCPILQMTAGQASLEDIFLEVTDNSGETEDTQT